MIERPQRVEHPGQPVAIVGRLGAMDGGDRVCAGAVPGGRLAEPRCGIPHLEQYVGHHIADEHRPLREPLGGEVGHRLLCRSEAEVRGMVRQYAVVLLGHPPVERPEAGFEVSQRQMNLDGCDGCGERRVRVAVDEDPIGSMFREGGLEGAEHRTGLRSVAAGPDSEMHVRRGDAEILEEDIAHDRVVVLARVDDDVLHAAFPGRPRDRREFDELGTGSDDADDPHGRRVYKVVSMRPGVDLIIAVHSTGRPVSRAVRSALADPRDDVRVTVVCHDIDEREIAAMLGPLVSDQRVRLIEHRDGIRSPSGPFNAGLDASTAPWVSIMGSDDELDAGALAHWSAVARRQRADIVLPRIVLVGPGSQRIVVATPPSRPFRRARLDGVRDRLAYRSAPLGMLRRELIGDLRFGGGLPRGEDVLFSSRLWYSDASIAITRGPAYRVHDDARDRVTLRPDPIGGTLAFIEEVVTDRIIRALPTEARLALGMKLVRVNVLGEFVNRPTPDRWIDTERDALHAVVQSVMELAPEIVNVLPRADRSVLDALPASSGVNAVELLAIARARRAFASPAALLPRSITYALHREAPLRFIAASVLARRR